MILFSFEWKPLLPGEKIENGQRYRVFDCEYNVYMYRDGEAGVVHASNLELVQGSPDSRYQFERVALVEEKKVNV